MDSVYLFLSSLKRNLWKIGLLTLLGFFLIQYSENRPTDLGQTFAPLFYGFGLAFNGLAFSILAMCVIDPHVNSVKLAKNVEEKGCSASGLMYIGRCILVGIVMALFMLSAKAQEIPPAAVAKLPIVKQELTANWPSLQDQSWIPAQIDKETCITPTHSKCWNEKAELKTARERGIGLPQLTKAFNPNGTIRFDALTEIRTKYPKELANLSWDNPYDARMQIRAMVLKERDACRTIKGAKTESDLMRMCLVAYNGGLGGLQKDRLACSAKPGCDPSQWYGHVELTSLKSKVPMPGYGGQSPYSISRKYPKEIEYIRRPKYILAMG